MVDYSYLPKKYKLKLEQIDALYFCYEKDTAIMSLGTGVGKTITSCILVKQFLKEIPNSIAVFIVPAKAVKAFKKELKACQLEYNLWESSGKTYVKGARVLVTTHTALPKYINELKALRKYYCIGVIDEIHNFSANYDNGIKLNKGTELLVQLRPIFNKFYALTATTVKNDSMSLYTMCNIVRPNFFGSPEQFKKNYCVVEKQFFKVKPRWSKSPITISSDKIVGFKNREALQKKIDDLIIFRQLSYNVEFNEIDIPFDMWDNYREVGRGNITVKSKAQKQSLSEFGVRLGSLQKLMDNVPLYDEEDNQIFPIKMSNKEEALIRLIEDLIDGHHIPLVYCFYWDTIDRLKTVLQSRLGDKIEEIFVISGQVPPKKRADIEDKIRENTVTILNKAGTESINLQKADTLIFYNIPWGIQEYLQCLGRITRNDTEFTKQYVYFLEYEGTIDNYKMIKIKDKLGKVEQVQGDQLDSSEGISIDTDDMKECRNLLLWTYQNNSPVSKATLLKHLKRDE